MNDNHFNEIVNENDIEWGNDENDEIIEDNSIYNKLSNSYDWSKDWEDFDESDVEWNTFGNTTNDNDSNNNIYYLDGYGDIYELDNYLNNSDGIIELLRHSKNKEQFNYILGMSREEGHDDNLLNYLISINYSIEDYTSINVGYQIFKYENLVEYLLSKADNNQVKNILSKIGYVNEKVANIISKSDDRINLINSNYHLRDKIVTRKIIQYFKENPDKTDLNVIKFCDLDTDIIRDFISMGYKISEDSPYNLLENNEIMREEFLKKVNIEDKEIFNKLDNEIKSIPGAYRRLFQSKTKEIFKKEYVDTFGKSAVEEMIKYIVLGDYEINLSKVNADNIKDIKYIYDILKTESTFDIQLFTKIIYKFNINPNSIKDIPNSNIEKAKLKLYFEFKELMINDIDDLNNIEELLYKYENNKIEAANNVIDLKNVICNLLTNQTYFETKKGLLELANKEKLSVLKNSIKSEDFNKKLDSFIILSDFIEKIDEIDDIIQLRKLAYILNQQILKYGINDNYIDFNKKIMNFYSLELN